MVHVTAKVIPVVQMQTCDFTKLVQRTWCNKPPCHGIIHRVRVIDFSEICSQRSFGEWSQTW